MILENLLLEVSLTATYLFEILGIVVIVIGAVVAIARYLFQCGSILTGSGNFSDSNAIASFRKTLGRSILTGLELLVAADIIRTVAVDPSIESVAVLGMIVLIRTFLSYSLEVEIDGKWPWQKKGVSGA